MGTFNVNLELIKLNIKFVFVFATKQVSTKKGNSVKMFNKVNLHYRFDISKFKVKFFKSKNNYS